MSGRFAAMIIAGIARGLRRLRPMRPITAADQAVGEVVHLECVDQIWCGSFSTIQVWPLATSAWRSGVLPEAAAAFCSMTALSKVGAGSS